MNRRLTVVIATAAGLAASSLGVAWAAGGLDSDSAKEALTKRAADLDRALADEKRELARIAKSGAPTRKRTRRGPRGPRGSRGAKGDTGATGPRGLGGVTVVHGPTVQLCDFAAFCAVGSSLAVCPAGQVALGGGWDSISPGIEMIASVNRTVGTNAWGVIMVNYYGSPDFRALATCAPA